MKLTMIPSLMLCLIPASGLWSEETVTFEKVHLCCNGCVRAVEKAVSSIEGARVAADKDTGTVVLTGPDKKTLRQGMNAIWRAGFYGVSDNKSIAIKDRSGAEGKTVRKLTIRNVHLCCGGCVDAVDEALATVEGVTGHTAEKNKPAFEVEGEFNDKAVIEALNQAGFGGRVGG